MSVTGQTGRPPAGQTKTAGEWFASGLRLQRAGDHEKALEAYRAAIKLDAQHFGAQLNSGVSQMVLEKYEEAVGAFKEAARIMPKEAAIEPYKRAATLKPHHVLYFSLGTTYQKLGRLGEAVEALQKSLEIKPTFTHALYELGAIYYAQGRYPEAIESFGKVLQTEPAHVYANHALGLVYVITGNKTGAMQQYYILKDLNADTAANLLRAISK